MGQTWNLAQGLHTVKIKNKNKIVSTAKKHKLRLFLLIKQEVVEEEENLVFCNVTLISSNLFIDYMPTPRPPFTSNGLKKITQNSTPKQKGSRFTTGSARSVQHFIPG